MVCLVGAGLALALIRASVEIPGGVAVASGEAAGGEAELVVATEAAG